MTDEIALVFPERILQNIRSKSTIGECMIDAKSILLRRYMLISYNMGNF